MWFDEAGEVMEMFRHSFPLSLVFFVPILIIISPVSPVAGAHDFTVYRMQQYDLGAQGSSFGSRSSLVSAEARHIDAKMLTRRCAVTKLRELTIDRFKEVVSQNAAALLVLLPPNLLELPEEEKQHLLELERDLIQDETQTPVYFSYENDELQNLYEDVKNSVNSDQAGSAAEALLSSASANGFQMVVTGSQAKALSDFQLVNLQGKLSGYGIEEQLPTIAVVAHYDAFGIAPSLAAGADSNGSGVVALLELARLFSKLYTNSRTHAKYNLIFLLSGAGKFNYQGSKRWIEDQLDTAESSLLSDAAYVFCLDSLGADDTLFMHVSKPPKEGSSSDILYKNLLSTAASYSPQVNFSMVHKKINLADDFLAWEHERFSIRRLPAFTLSHLESFKDPMRSTILDTRNRVDTAVLTRNVKIIAEALAQHIFNLSHEGNFEIFNEGLKVEEGLVSAWLEFLSSQSRAAQLLTKDSAIVTTLEQTLSRYLKDVKKILVKADKRDPEFMFYDGAEYKMNAYNVKPAVFDLFLALAIASYLGVIYFIVQNFSTVHSALRRVVGPIKAKQA